MVLLGLLMVTLVAVGGCQQAKDAWSSIRGGDGDAEQAEATAEAKPDLEAELERERKLAERDRLEAERREREALAAEALRAQRQAADELVAVWADRLAQAKAEDGAFVQHQGLTEDDPWAKPIRVTYARDEDTDRQTLEVRSAGPNGSFDDDDDLVRTRDTQIERPWLERYKWWLLGGFVWIGIGFISAGGFRRRRHRKQESRDKVGEDDGLFALDLVMSAVHIGFAPLSLLVWLLILVIEIIGEVAD